MRLLKWLPFACFAALIPQASFGQYAINTIAGGGPNNLSPLVSSIGYTGSVARDAAGNIYVSDSYSSHVYKVATGGNLTIVAGNGTLGYSGDGGPATSAALNGPEGIFVDSSGNIFIADTANSVIREVVASTGNIQTVAGNGTAGYLGDGGPATSAELNDPFGVFVDTSANIFIADTDNSVIREVVASTGYIETVVGTGTACTSFTSAGCGDGGPATSAELDEPEGVFLDSSGDIFIADTYDSVIREVVANTGNIQTVAGTYYDRATNDTCQYSGDGSLATSAALCLPSSIYLDGSNNLYIADTFNSVVREVVASSADIQTVAGNGTPGYSGDGSAATSAELNYPSGVIVDSSANLYIADTDNSVVREVSAGNISTIVGNNTLAYSGDGGAPTDAALNYPGQVVVDSSGDIFFADTENSVIREVVAATGNIQTVAGNGTPSYSGDGGLATVATLNIPYGVYVDGSGNIFIADTNNSVIREVVATTGDIQTVAGNNANPPTFAGDGGPATSATLYHPYAVLLDANGNIYIADTENSAIRVVNTGTAAITIAGVTIQPGDIETVAGTGSACSDSSQGCGDGGVATSAQLNFPEGIALDASGNFYISDTDNNAIREVNASTGIIQTVAGTLGQRGYSGDNGAPTSALLDSPKSIVIDSNGNLFITDSDNSVIREVATVSDTIVTVAGTGTPGFSGDGGSSTSAALNTPFGLAVSSSGTLYLADTDNSRIRQLTASGSVSVVPTSASVPLGATQQFAATVSPASATVTWQVNAVTGGNSTVGTIDSTGLYQAPTTMPSSSTVTVTAVSSANGIASGSATVTLVSSSVPAVTVSSSPSGVTEVYTGTTQTLSASVSGGSSTSVRLGNSHRQKAAATADASTSGTVNWQVNGVAGGNSTYGTITSDGTYTAPAGVPSNPLILVTAVSQANPAVFGSYPFSIVTAPSATSPAPQTISPGQYAQYSISLNANTGNPKQPITLSCASSSLPPGATCTFAPSTITPGTQAVPFTMTVKVPAGTTTASLQRSADHGALIGRLYISLMPLAGILLFATRSPKRAVRLLCLAILITLPFTIAACGGGSGGGTGGGGSNPEAGTYTIQLQGTTVAQPNPVTITTAGLTVQ